MSGAVVRLPQAQGRRRPARPPLRGRVVSANGRALAEVTLRVLTPEKVTDASSGRGRAAPTAPSPSTDIPAGRYLLRGELPGFSTASVPVQPGGRRDAGHRAAAGPGAAAGGHGPGRPGAPAGPGGAVRLAAGRAAAGGRGREPRAAPTASSPWPGWRRGLDGDGGGARLRDAAPGTGGRPRPPAGAAAARARPAPWAAWWWAPTAARWSRPGCCWAARRCPPRARRSPTTRGCSCSTGWASAGSCCGPPRATRVSQHEAVQIDEDTGWLPPAKLTLGAGRHAERPGGRRPRAPAGPGRGRADRRPPPATPSRSSARDKEGSFTRHAGGARALPGLGAAARPRDGHRARGRAARRHRRPAGDPAVPRGADPRPDRGRRRPAAGRGAGHGVRPERPGHPGPGGAAGQPAAGLRGREPAGRGAGPQGPAALGGQRRRRPRPAGRSAARPVPGGGQRAHPHPRAQGPAHARAGPHRRSGPADPGRRRGPQRAGARRERRAAGRAPASRPARRDSPDPAGHRGGRGGAASSRCSCPRGRGHGDGQRPPPGARGARRHRCWIPEAPPPPLELRLLRADAVGRGHRPRSPGPPGPPRPGAGLPAARRAGHARRRARRWTPASRSRWR